MRIEQVEEGIGILIKRRRVHDNLVVLGHLDEEFVDTRSLHDVDKVDHVLNLDGDDKVGTGDGPEAGMHQGLVEVQHQALLPQIIGMVRRQQLHLVLRRGILVQDLLLRFAGGVLRPLAVLVVVGRRVARDGGGPAGAEGGRAGRRGPPDGLGGRRGAGVLGNEAAAHHPEGFQEGIAGVDVDPALPVLGGRAAVHAILVGVAALNLVRVELVPGVVHGLAVRRDVYVRLGTGRVLLPGPGDGVGAPGRGGVAVLVRLGDEVGYGDGLPSLILGGGRRRGGSDGGLIVNVDGGAAPTGGDGGLLDAWTAQVAPAADSGGSLGLVVHGRLVRGGSGGIGPGGRGLAAGAVAVASTRTGTAGGMMPLVVLGVGGPGIDVGTAPTETAEADPTTT